MKNSLLIFSLLFMLTSSFCQSQKINSSSEGVALNAYLYKAPGNDLKPTLIWCHGNPGGKEEGQSKLAIEMNKKGINVVRFNYRGLWGTAGEYTHGNCGVDLSNVLNFVLQKENSTAFKIDTSRVIVGGYSHGSNITIVSAMHDD